MLKLRKKKERSVNIFKLILTYESLPASLQSFKKTLYNHFRKSPREIMVHDEHSSFGVVKKYWQGVNALLLMLCRLCFNKSFESDNHVYCDLNNSTLTFFI